MKNLIVLIIALLSVFHIEAQDVAIQKKWTKEGYKLAWSDEFDKNGIPNPANWSYEKGFVRNNELQWYQAQNSTCENGFLIIEAKREQRPNPNYIEGSKDWRKSRPMIDFSSSCMITAGKKAWQYGRFEMRARIDISQGIWPAWWTLGVEKDWPANGEIDIMEFYRGKVLANIACLSANKRAEWHSNTFAVDSLGGAKWAAQFHVWRMDWEKDFIALYLDEQLLNKVLLKDLVNKDGTGFNPFQQPHYMLLDLAIGGDNGGDPYKSTFPSRFEVDYVRVYQKE